MTKYQTTKQERKHKCAATSLRGSNTLVFWSVPATLCRDLGYSKEWQQWTKIVIKTKTKLRKFVSSRPCHQFVLNCLGSDWRLLLAVVGGGNKGPYYFHLNSSFLPINPKWMFLPGFRESPNSDDGRKRLRIMRIHICYRQPALVGDSSFKQPHKLP